MDAETFFALFLLAIVLLVAGLAMAVRLLSPDRAAYRRGQADARRDKIRRDLMDAYWAGYSGELVAGDSARHRYPAPTVTPRCVTAQRGNAHVE